MRSITAKATVALAVCAAAMTAPIAPAAAADGVAGEAVKLLFESYRIENNLPGMKRLRGALTRCDVVVEPALKARVLAAIAAFEAAHHVNRARVLTGRASDAATASDPKLAARAKAHQRAAAVAYEEAARVATTLRDRATLWQNAAVMHERAGDAAGAVAALEQGRKAAIAALALRENGADSRRDGTGGRAALRDRLGRILGFKAALQLKLHDVDGAILSLLERHRTQPGAEGLAALADAARLSARTDRQRQALELFARLRDEATVQGDDKLVREACRQRLLLAGALGDSALRRRAAKDLIRRFGKAPDMRLSVASAHAVLARDHRGAGDARGAARHWAAVARLAGPPAEKGRSKALRALAAEAAFARLQPRFDAFIARKVTAPPGLPPQRRIRALQRGFVSLMNEALGTPRKVRIKGKRVTRRVGGLSAAYRDEVAAQGARDWSYAAFLRRGQVMLHSSRVIAAVPLPPGLTPEQEEAAGEVIDKIVMQLENRGLQLMATALRDARSRGVTNRRVDELHKTLHAYRPGAYPAPRPAYRD